MSVITGLIFVDMPKNTLLICQYLLLFLTLLLITFKTETCGILKTGTYHFFQEISSSLKTSWGIGIT